MDRDGLDFCLFGTGIEEITTKEKPTDQGRWDTGTGGREK